MSYTVTEAYNRILEEGDKIGSDYFILPHVLKAFKKQTLDFVGARATEVELTQQVTDDIRPLVSLKKIGFIPNPDDSLHLMASLPNDYHTRLNANVLYSDGLTSRKPTIERFGEHNTNMISPYKRPERLYPIIQQFSTYFNVITGLPSNSTITAEKFIITYIKQPTFGKLQNDVVVNLPDNVCEYLFAATANALQANTGDERAPFNFQINNSFRKK